MSRPIRFGLFVTGKGEARALDHPFSRAMASQAHCIFQVIRKIEQLRPRTGKKPVLKVTGSKQPVSSRDQELGLAALRFLQEGTDRRFVLVIDDLEDDDPFPVFQRYRQALDSVLARPGLADRAAVHFLVKMLEAYFFAHADAVNKVAGRTILAEDHQSDVEMTITHPKNQLIAIWPEYRETEHGVEVTRRLDLAHLLAPPDQCCWLRALVAWCYDRLQEPDILWTDIQPLRDRLESGCRIPLTYQQRP